MGRAVLLSILLVAAAGCASEPTGGWDDSVPAIRPLGPIRSPQGLLIVRTDEVGVREEIGAPTRRGFQVRDEDGHLVHRERPYVEDWGSIRLFPGRYLVLTYARDGVFERHWDRAQVVVEAGKLTAVDFVAPRPRAAVPEPVPTTP